MIQNSGSWEAVYLTKALQDFKKEKDIGNISICQKRGISESLFKSTND